MIFYHFLPKEVKSGHVGPGPRRARFNLGLSSQTKSKKERNEKKPVKQYNHAWIKCLRLITGDSDSREPACSVGDLGSIPGLGRSLGGGHGNPFQYSCLENPHGQRNLAGYSPWGCKELDTTEQLRTQHNSGEVKYILKTKDKFDKSGARETEGWSSWFGASQGQGHLAQYIYCEKNMFLSDTGHTTLGYIGADWKMWSSLRIGEAPTFPNWNLKRPHISSGLKILDVSLAHSKRCNRTEGNIYPSLSNGKGLHKKSICSLGLWLTSTFTTTGHLNSNNSFLILVLMYPVYSIIGPLYASY